MKKLAIALSLLVSAAAFSADVPSLAFNETLLKKDLKNQFGIYYVANRFFETWCANRGNAFNVASYEAAQYLDTLADGLYRCTGNFTQVPGDRTQPVTMYKIDSCVEVNPTDLRANCPTKP